MLGSISKLVRRSRNNGIAPRRENNEKKFEQAKRQTKTIESPRGDGRAESALHGVEQEQKRTHMTTYETSYDLIPSFESELMPT